MRFFESIRDENELVAERYQLARERISEFKTDREYREPFRDYFAKMSEFTGLLTEISDLVLTGEWYRLSLEELQEWNEKLYHDILPSNYDTSYGNPSYAAERLGLYYGRLLSAVYSELRSMTACAFEGRLYLMTAAMELLLQLHTTLETEGEYVRKETEEALYYYIHDYMEDFALQRTRERQDPTYTFARDIIMESDLSDLRYLYYFGVFITENELKMAGYLNSLPEETIQKMADTYTGGYVRGFATMGADFSAKTIVGIRYAIGFERMLQKAITSFEKMGKQVTVCRAVMNLTDRTYGRLDGYFATSANPQYEYDHKNDMGLYFDRKIGKAVLKASKAAAMHYQPEYAAYAGPAVLEIFGEPDFVPVNKKAAVPLSKRCSRTIVETAREKSLMLMDYLKQEEISYTIIAFPLPSIGEDFERIFYETIRVNTLDNAEYIRMQQILIDTLDQGNSCLIRGCGRNRTDMKVMLHTLTKPKEQTNFENCTADVNIPVGEVFTSPVLTDTCGTLHVSRVFLNGLEFIDLELTFENGWLTSYRCANFESEEENSRYIRENILNNHDTLPIGEFAIGTNTIAYAMGQRYGIQSRLPILIAEKTGPHFAVGDTCYKMSEDHVVYNPNGKEIIARENEVSALRTTEIEKAYLNCHCDITIPFDEIGEISAVLPDGSRKVIIENGRFVLPGAEGLNAGLDELRQFVV